ncbi:complex I NDUFA9 subunit family protein [Roseateles sp. BYS180W]|uniref:Complex I NDUFA9 subunit family protein n=1 Tax=Roseateles rivi TaxID=3299028 RepID=A0ABW7FWP2_9BURK
MRVLVLGGSGFVGRSFCARWCRAQGGSGTITLPTRQLRNVRSLRTQPGLSVVRADIHNPDTLRALVAKHDAVLNLVAILHGKPAEFERTHVQLVSHIISACQREGVRRLVHVSALGVDEVADMPSDYLRSKARAEALIRASGLDYTVLRPSVIFGKDDRFMNLFAALQRRLPLMALGGAQARMQPVWVEDVAKALVHTLLRPETIGHTYELGGPRQWQLRELVQAAGRWSRGHARPVLPLPAPLAWLQAAALEWWPGGPLLSRDNLRSLQRPNVLGNSLPGLADLGVAAADLQTIAPSYLAEDPKPAAR